LTFASAMGGSQSQPVDLPALPQQRIVNVRDGQAETIDSHQVQIGQTQQAVAVRPSMSLLRGTFRQEGRNLSLELLAKDAGFVELVLPALEFQKSNAWPKISSLGPPPNGGTGTRTQGGQRLSISASSDPQSISFDCATGLETLQRLRHPEGVAWPAVLILRPGPNVPGTLDADPPDGTMLAFCRVQAGSLAVVRQLIAWGGNGAAFEMKDMFGLQDAKGNEDANSSQRNCVICLTAPRDTAVLPCSHFCVCYDCGLSVRLNPQRAKCPLCRGDVKDLVRITNESSTNPTST